MTKSQKFYQKSQWSGTALFESQIIRFIEQNKICLNGKIKNVFYIRSTVYSDGIMCIYWERTSALIGDIVACKGKLNKNNILLIESMLILQHYGETK